MASTSRWSWTRSAEPGAGSISVPAYIARHAGDLTRLVASKWGLAWHVAARVLFGTKVSEGHGRATGPDAPVAPDVPAGRPARQVR